jgi:hypothetical protein
LILIAAISFSKRKSEGFGAEEQVSDGVEPREPVPAAAMEA